MLAHPNVFFSEYFWACNLYSFVSQSGNASNHAGSVNMEVVYVKLARGSTIKKRTQLNIYFSES